MQKFIRVISALNIFFFCSCHNTTQETVSASRNEENNFFFPVTDFLLGQLNEADTLPVTPLKINITGDRRDSVWLKNKDIRKFASPFLQPVIDSVSMHNLFTERSFMDQTLDAVTFSYDPKIRLPDSIKLNHWDVYLDPQKSSVRRIYLVKEENINSESITTQLTWNVGKWYSIRTITQQQNKKPEVKEEIMKWDFDE